MKIAIVDDEVHCIESLIIHLNHLFPEVEISYKSNKVQEALQELPTLDIDLLFLDIEMPKLDGFQLLEQLPHRNFNVIFTTAYSQYAIQAFKAKAINYLLKPIDEQELEDAVNEWKSLNAQKKNGTDELNNLLEHLKKEGILKSKISVPVSNGYEFIEVKDIMYGQSNSNYTTLYLSDGEKILISKTLKNVEQILNKFFFIRVHQSYIVNPNYLQKFNRKDGGFLIMEDNKQIPISPKKKSLVIGLFNS